MVNVCRYKVMRLVKVDNVRRLQYQDYIIINIKYKKNNTSISCPLLFIRRVPHNGINIENHINFLKFLNLVQ